MKCAPIHISRRSGFGHPIVSQRLKTPLPRSLSTPCLCPMFHTLSSGDCPQIAAWPLCRRSYSPPPTHLLVHGCECGQASWLQQWLPVDCKAAHQPLKCGLLICSAWGGGPHSTHSTHSAWTKHSATHSVGRGLVHLRLVRHKLCNLPRNTHHAPLPLLLLPRPPSTHQHTPTYLPRVGPL